MGASESEENLHEKLEVVDPDEYNRNRRFRQIHDARERVPESLREDSERVTDGEITEERYRELISEAVIDYIIEVEPLMRSSRIAHNEELSAFWDKTPVLEDDPEGPITLRDIVEENGEVLNDGREPLDRLRVRAAYRLVNRFLNEVGIGPEIDDDRMIGHPRKTKEADYL